MRHALHQVVVTHHSKAALLSSVILVLVLLSSIQGAICMGPKIKGLLSILAGLKADRAQFPDVSRALEKVALEKGYQLHQNWLNKCIQLYETYLVCGPDLGYRPLNFRQW